MSRFGADPRAFFGSVYQGAAPWEIGGIQPAMGHMIDQFPPMGPALDLGCASGDLSIHLASLGLDVVGIDFVETAIEQAQSKCSSLPPDVASRLAFRVADAMEPSALGPFGSVFDSGFMHLLDIAETDRLVAELRGMIVPAGRLYLHEFTVEFPMENVPRAVTEDELRSRFNAETGWRILYLDHVEFLNTVAMPTPAIVACIERM